LLYPVFFSFFLLLTYSCSEKEDNSPEDLVDGTFTVSISGEESRSLSGEASFVHVLVNSGVPDGSGTSLALSLYGGDDSEDAIVITLTKREAKLFSAGTYSYKEDPADNEVFLSVGMFSQLSQGTYIITSGNVKINKVSNNQLEGSLDVSLTNFNEKNISISGSFKANGITQGF
ncbi:MAG: hypothetical protein IH594_14930, partial [Bacteroidales bacterium]|nr:hypothetical protein [Bacteroidales bacterium]